jgi:hypothetical protein
MVFGCGLDLSDIRDMLTKASGYQPYDSLDVSG